MKSRSLAAYVLNAFAAGLVLCNAAVGAEPAPATTAAAPKGPFKEISWEDLTPKGWDPYKKLRDAKVGRLIDGDPKTTALMSDLRQVLDNAPTNDTMNGQAIKLPGYVVPLEESKGGLTEFLLVPYFGACIHSPPPPSNQIVHVVLSKPLKGYRAMDPVWVSGTLAVTRQESAMGTSGYALQASVVARYEAQRAR